MTDEYLSPFTETTSLDISDDSNEISSTTNFLQKLTIFENIVPCKF